MGNEYRDVTMDALIASRTKICGYCGKTFYIPIYCSQDKWIYKLTLNTKKSSKRVFCCSWNCFNKLKYGGDTLLSEKTSKLT